MTDSVRRSSRASGASRRILHSRRRSARVSRRRRPESFQDTMRRREIRSCAASSTACSSPAHRRWASRSASGHAFSPTFVPPSSGLRDHDRDEELDRFVRTTLDEGHEGSSQVTRRAYRAGRRGTSAEMETRRRSISWSWPRSGVTDGAAGISATFISAPAIRRARLRDDRKTFKGMTDAMLAWQTERFLALEQRRETGPSTSSRASWWRSRSTACSEAPVPGGVALRFARVKRYRETRTRPNPTRSTPCEASTDVTRRLPVPGRGETCEESRRPPREPQREMRLAGEAARAQPRRASARCAEGDPSRARSAPRQY